jgi:uracil-DNA glycosylase
MLITNIEERWRIELKEVIDSDWYEQLALFILREYSEKTIFPPENQIFNSFKYSPWDQTRVVILGQDPYINPGQAHGLSFSVPDGIPKPPSLQNIFKQIRLETGQEIPESGNLTHWANQGVLLLNTVLTVQAGLSNSHQGMGWEKFTDQVIHLLSEKKENLVFMLWGNHARKKAELINSEKHFILESAHPSPMSVTRGFFGNGHFGKCNQFLESKGLKPIIW